MHDLPKPRLYSTCPGRCYAGVVCEAGTSCASPVEQELGRNTWIEQTEEGNEGRNSREKADDLHGCHVDSRKPSPSKGVARQVVWGEGIAELNCHGESCRTKVPLPRVEQGDRASALPLQKT